MNNTLGSRRVTPHPLGKRLACDRCRGQKLKCERSDASAGKCKRCNTAKAECSYGTPRPSGRPSIAAGPMRHSNQGTRRDNTEKLQGVGSAQQHGYYPSPASATSDAFLNVDFAFQNEGHAIKYQNSAGVTTPSTASVGFSSSANHFDPDSLLSTLGEPDFMDFEASQATSSWTASDCRTSTFSDGKSILPYENLGPSALPRTSEAGPQSISTRSQGLSELKKLRPVTPSVATVHGSGNGHPDGPGCQNLSDAEDWAPSTFTETSVKLLISTSGTQFTSRTQLLQQISKLETVLCALITEINSKDESPGQSAIQYDFPDTLVGKVLRASSMFLSVLKSFNDSTTPVISSHNLSTRFGSPNGSAFPTTLDSFELPNQQTGGEFERMWRSSSSSCTSMPTRAEKKTLPIDKPTAQQLLACYLQFTQLHRIIYLKIYEYVIATELDTPLLQVEEPQGGETRIGLMAESQIQRHPIFPDLQISGVSLAEFGNYHIKLVLWVCTHMLAEVETALGLSEGYRVSKRNIFKGSGILGANVTAQFIEMSMSDFGTPRDITHIKDLLSKLKTLLSGGIRL